MKIFMPMLLLLTSTSLYANPVAITLESFLKKHKFHAVNITENNCECPTPDYTFYLTIENNKAVFYQGDVKMEKTKKIIEFLELCAQAKNQSNTAVDLDQLEETYEKN